MFKKRLARTLWEKESYYHLAKKASIKSKHPGIIEIKKLAGRNKKILDLGCGEGSKLNLIAGKNNLGFGVDLSSKAVKIAKKNYPHLNFVRSDIESLPFKNEEFDLVYFTFVLEHLDRPEKVIREAARVTKMGGFLAFLSPNFGAPNRASPPFKGNRFIKFIKGVITDFVLLFKGIDKLYWNKVTPLSLGEVYQTDWDTTIEPYLLTLVIFLKRIGLKIIKRGSFWVEELPGAKLHQRLFRILGEMGIYPFEFWGPHLFVIAQKP